MRDDPPARHVRRWLRLVAFERVALPATGARRRTVRLDVTAEHLARLDDDGKGWHVAPGAYRVVCGTHSADRAARSVTAHLSDETAQ